MNYFRKPFGSPSFTKYDFGRHAMITVTDPEPVDYVQLRRDAQVIVLRQVANPDVVVTFDHSRFGELMRANKVTIDPTRFDTARQEAPVAVPKLKRACKLQDEENDDVEFYRRLIHSINNHLAAS